jgi:hypothetical protein
MTVQYRRETAVDGIVRYSTGMTNLISYIVHIKAGQTFSVHTHAVQHTLSDQKVEK